MSENEERLLTDEDMVDIFCPRWELENQLRKVWDRVTRDACIEVFGKHRSIYVWFHLLDKETKCIDLYDWAPRAGLPQEELEAIKIAEDLTLDEALERLRSEIEEGIVSAGEIKLYRGPR